MISPLVVEGGSTYDGLNTDNIEHYLTDTVETEPELSQNVQDIIELVKSRNYIEERNEMFKSFKNETTRGYGQASDETEKNETEKNETTGGYGQASLFFGSDETETEEYTEGANEYFEW